MFFLGIVLAIIGLLLLLTGHFVLGLVLLAVGLILAVAAGNTPYRRL